MICWRTVLSGNDAYVNTQNDTSNTPLRYAASNCKAESVKALLAHPNVNSNIQDNMGQTLLSIIDYQRSSNRQELISLFIEHGATPDTSSY